MNDLSEYVKAGLLDARKKLIRKSYQQKTLMERLNDFNDKKRESRNAILCQKRKIDESMEEIKDLEKKLKVSEEVQKPSKRLEMLQKWKAEKGKRLQEEKEKKKPVFKVCRVPDTIALPNFEPNKKQGFAPPGHKFKPPKNIKPVDMKPVKSTVELGFLHEKSKGKLDKTENQHLQMKSKDNAFYQRNTRAFLRSQQVTKDPSTTSKSSSNSSSSSAPEKLVRPKTKPSIINTRSQAKKESLLALTNKNKNKKLAEKEISDTKLNCLPVTSPLKTGNGSNTNSSNIKKTPSKPNKKSAAKRGSSQKENIDSKLLSVDKKLSSSSKKKKNKTSKSEKAIVPVECVPDNKKDNVSPVTPVSTQKTSKQSSDSAAIHLSETVGINEYSIGMATGSASPDYPMDMGEITTEDSVFNTPLKQKQEDFPVYVSPFVTISRGKTSARKEYHQRHSSGACTPGSIEDISKTTSPRIGAEYFTKILNREIDRLESICDTWNTYKQDNELPEEANDMINVAIGQSKLLISKKFQQFRNLIEQCKTFNITENIVTCEDLHGFWDMLFMQVEDLNKRFNNLDKLKANNWHEILPQKKPAAKRTKRRSKKAAPSEALKNHIKAARMKQFGNSEDVCEILLEEKETKKFSGGYFFNKSPVDNFNDVNMQPSSVRRSSRISQQTRRGFSSSPGLTMLKISQAIKCGDGITPSRSILKSDVSKSEKRITKTVLFKED